MDKVPEFYAKDRAAWRQWLAKNHDTQSAIWLVYDKGEKRTMQWSDIVQEALCFGWIDSRPRKRDDGRSMIYISKRKPKSVWSKINKAHVEELTKNGLMMPAGQAAIETAKANGAWESLTLSDNLVLPNELQAAFADYPTIARRFDEFSESNRRNLLEWIYSAKKQETRSQRIEKLITGLADSKKATEIR